MAEGLDSIMSVCALHAAQPLGVRRVHFHNRKVEPIDIVIQLIH